MVRGAVLILALVLLCACEGTGGKYTEAELRPLVEELVTASLALNEIYFGEGLPASEDEEYIARFQETFGKNVSTKYAPVDPACGYRSIADIRAATAQVYTEAYCEYLFTMAFSGITHVESENTEEQLTTTVVYARYLEKDGFLTVRKEDGGLSLELLRTYDFSDFSIEYQQGRKIVIEVQSLWDGVPDQRVQLTLWKQGDGTLRLDTPTY